MDALTAEVFDILDGAAVLEDVHSIPIVPNKTLDMHVNNVLQRSTHPWWTTPVRMRRFIEGGETKTGKM